MISNSLWAYCLVLILIQSDQKVSVHLIIRVQKVAGNVQVSLTSLQTFIDAPNCVLEDRVQYSTVHIPNVFRDGHLQIINCAGIFRIHCLRYYIFARFLYYNRQVHRDFLNVLYNYCHF
jgi:hypothetical protein